MLIIIFKWKLAGGFSMSILNQTVCCLGYNFLYPDGSSAFPVDLNCTIQIHGKRRRAIRIKEIVA